MSRFGEDEKGNKRKTLMKVRKKNKTMKRMNGFKSKGKETNLLRKRQNFLAVKKM